MLACVASVACSAHGARPDPVRPGIEVLIDDSLHLVRDERVGLLTNQTGVGRSGVRDIELLIRAGVRLTTIITPEHGLRGILDRENIGHGVDSATGLPVYSLYGDVRAPTAEMLAEVDVLLIDLQDIGGRPYTYISSALLALESAERHGRRVIVLDRPNPIGGLLVQGPMLEPRFASFVGMLQVPLRHGMTLGELAWLGNQERGIGADLVVIPAGGWRRATWYDETGLPWVRPSPNMPSVESATHYPGVVLFEATNLSVGRGTPVAFQVVAAPWLDARALRAMLDGSEGVRVTDTTVTPLSPSDGKYPGTPLPAIRLTVTERGRYDPTRLALRVLSAIMNSHADSLTIDAKGFDARAGTESVRAALTRGEPSEAIWRRWTDMIAAFREHREPYLLYP